MSRAIAASTGGTSFPEPAAFQIGLAAIELAFAELVPKLGRPVAVQRKLEFTLAPGLDWTIQCFLDLETGRPDSDGQLTPAVIDYKVKGSPALPTARRSRPASGAIPRRPLARRQPGFQDT